MMQGVRARCGAVTALLALAMFCGAVAHVLVGCQGTNQPANVSPTLGALGVSPGGTVAAGAVVTVSADATDADGDAIAYTWAATGGAIGGSGRSIQWTAPAAPGAYTVTCTVSDGRGGTATRSTDITVTGSVTAEGRIVYALAEGGLYRIEAREGATPENLSAALDALGVGTEDEWVNVSPDGEWLLVQTDRFDPDAVGWPGLALVAGDLSSAESVRAPAGLIHAEGTGCVASGGDLIVYSSPDGPHEWDLWAVARLGGAWGEPLLLTGASPYAFHSQPAISDGGSTVLCDAGDAPYAPGSTAICEVGTDGTGFRSVLTVVDSPAGFPDTGHLHHADYAPDGSIVFEASWAGETLWRLPLGASEPAQLSAGETNDNSPCVLPDGRIVSLYLQRPGNTEGVHEIKVLAADGSESVMLLTGVDVLDGVIGCGR